MKQTKHSNIKQFSFDSPQEAVFLRILAWEWYVARATPTVKETITNHLQMARIELGLERYELREKSGASDAYVQSLRKKGLLKKTKPVDQGSASWPKEWRLLYLPPHNTVRQLSNKPVYKCTVRDTTYREFVVSLRNPATPKVLLSVGSTVQDSQKCDERRRGIYFLRLEDDLYIGKTDELDTRLRQHWKKKSPFWFVYISLEDDPTFSLDSLGAAEGLIISLWNQISRLSNSNRGSDKMPAWTYLQQAIIFTQTVSAVFLWLVRDMGEEMQLNLPHWDIPFMKWTQKDWPECYLKIPDQI